MRAILAFNGLTDNKNMTYTTAIAIKQFQKYYSALTIKKKWVSGKLPPLGVVVSFSIRVGGNCPRTPKILHQT